MPCSNSVLTLMSGMVLTVCFYDNNRVSFTYLIRSHLCPVSKGIWRFIRKWYDEILIALDFIDFRKFVCDFVSLEVNIGDNMQCV